MHSHINTPIRMFTDTTQTDTSYPKLFLISPSSPLMENRTLEPNTDKPTPPFCFIVWYKNRDSVGLIKSSRITTVPLLSVKCEQKTLSRHLDC